MVYFGDTIQHGATNVTGDTRGIREIEDGVARTAELHSLVLGGEETTSPEAIIKGLGLTTPLGNHDDVTRQVAIGTSQTPAEPSSHRWLPGLLNAGVDGSNGWVMVNCLRVNGFNEGNLIGNAGDVGNNFAEPTAVLAMAREFEHGGHAGKGFLARSHTRYPLTLSNGVGKLDAVNIPHCGVVVVHVDMRRTTREK